MPEPLPFAPLQLSPPQSAPPPQQWVGPPSWKAVTGDKRFAERDTQGKMAVLDNWAGTVLQNRDKLPGFDPAQFYDRVQAQRASIAEAETTGEWAWKQAKQLPGSLRDFGVGFAMLAGEAAAAEKAAMQGKPRESIDRPIMRNLAGQSGKLAEGFIFNTEAEENKLDAMKAQFRDAVGREEFPKDPAAAKDWFTAWENTLRAQAKKTYTMMDGQALDMAPGDTRRSLTDNEDNLKGIAAFISTKNPQYLDGVLNRVTAGPVAAEADKMKEADTRGMAEWQKRAFDFAADPVNLLSTVASLGVGAAVAAPLKAGAMSKGAQVALRGGAVVADAEINAQASKLSAWLQNPNASDREMNEAAKQGRFAAYMFAGLGYGARKVVDMRKGKGDAPPAPPAQDAPQPAEPPVLRSDSASDLSDLSDRSDIPGTTTAPQPNAADLAYQMASNLEALPQRDAPLQSGSPARPSAGVMPRTLEPVPESPATLAAQAERMAEGRKPAMLITKGEVPPSIPKGFEMVEVAEGVVIYDPQTFDADGIREAAANNQLGDVLGYGVPAKAADADRGVVQRAADGTEIASVGVNAAEVPQVTAALEAQAKPGDTIAVEGPEKVIADRLAAIEQTAPRKRPPAPGIPLGPRGADIWNFLAENPIEIPRRKAGKQRGGEFDANLHQGVPPRYMKVFSQEGSPPDVVAQRAFDEGLIDAPNTEALKARMDGDYENRRTLKALDTKDAALDRNIESLYQAARPRKGKVPVEMSTLQVGDEMTIAGQQMTVDHIADGWVYVDGGDKFGNQQFQFKQGEVLHADVVRRQARKSAAPTVNQDRSPEAQAARFDEAKRIGKGGELPVPLAALQEGDIVTVDGTPLKVTMVMEDPFMDVPTVELEDGRRFGRQVLSGDKVVYAEKVEAQGKVSGIHADVARKALADEQARTRAETPAKVRKLLADPDQPVSQAAPEQAAPAPEPLSMESTDPATLAAEQDAIRQRNAARDEMAKRQNRKLSAGDLDTTGDMLDPLLADNPLFSRPNERGAYIAPEGTQEAARKVAAAGGASIGPHMDAAYMDAVKSGDMEAAQKMVDEAAKASGYNIGPVWHGTPDGRFVEFDAVKSGSRDSGWRGGKGFYFGWQKGMGEMYMRDNKGRIPKTAKNISAYLSTQSTLDLGNPTLEMANRLADAYEFFLHRSNREPWPRLKRDEFIKEFMEAKGMWGDAAYRRGLTLSSIGGEAAVKQAGFDSVKSPSEIVVYDSSQIKSADPVTYATKGNPIPLSERFNQSSPDIRYSYLAPEGTVEAARKVAAAGGASIGPGASSTGEWRTHKASLRLSKDTRLTPRTRELLLEGQDYRVLSKAETLAEARQIIESRGGLRAALDVLDDPTIEMDKRITIGQLAIYRIDMDRPLAKTPEAIEALDDLVDEVTRGVNRLFLDSGRGINAGKYFKTLSADSILSELAERVDERMEQKRNTPLGEKLKEQKIIIGSELEAVTKDKDQTARDIDAATKAELDRLNAELEAAKIRLREMEIAAATDANTTGKPISKTKRTQADNENRRIRQLERDIADLQELGDLDDASMVNELDRRSAERRARKSLAEGKQSETLKNLRAARDAMRKEVDNRATDQRSRTRLETDQRSRTRLETDIAEMDRLIREGTPEEIAAKLEPSTKPRRVMPDDLVQARLRLRNLQSEAIRLQSLMLGMPKELQTKVRDLAYRIRQAPDGIWKADLNRQLLAEIGRWEGVDALAIGEEYWLANILSGLNTTGVNIFGSGLNIFAREMVTAAAEKDMLTVGNMLAGMARGAKEGVTDIVRAWQGKDIVKWQEKMGIHETGMVKDKQSGKMKQRVRYSALERTSDIYKDQAGFKAWTMRKVALGRYVFRALGGQDGFFWRTAYEGRVSLAITRWARSEAAAKGGNVAHYVAEALHNSTDEASAAFKQATDEAKQLGINATDRDIRARAWEIMDTKRPQFARDEARRAADIGTFTNDPEGSMAPIAHAINYVVSNWVIPTRIGDVRAAKPVFPFVNTLANVVSGTMDFTPIGIWRGLHGKHIFGKDSMPFSEVEARQRMLLGIIGTTVGGLTYALAGKGKNPEDPYFDVYAMGPMDNNKRQQMKNRGWMPDSIKVGDKYFSFKDSPMAFMLSLIGGIRDMERYSNKYNEEDKWKRAAYVMAAVPGTMGRQGMMQGVETLGAVWSGQPNKLARFAEGVGKGFVPATGMLRDIGRMFDPTVVDSKTLAGAMLKDVPIIRRTLNEPALNIFGEPVKTVGLGGLPIISRIASSKNKDPQIDFLAANGLWVPGISDVVNVGQGLTTKGEKGMIERLVETREQKLGRIHAKVLTDAETRTFIKLQGQYLRKGIAFMKSRHANGIGAKDKEGMQTEVDNITTIARKMAMRDLLGLPQRR